MISRQAAEIQTQRLHCSRWALSAAVQRADPRAPCSLFLKQSFFLAGLPTGERTITYMAAYYSTLYLKKL